MLLQLLLAWGWAGFLRNSATVRKRVLCHLSKCVPLLTPVVWHACLWLIFFCPFKVPPASMVWAVNQHTHQSLSTSPSPQSLGHIKKRAHRVLLCEHIISTNNQLRKTQGKPGRRGLRGRNPEVFCLSSPEVRIRFFPSFSILPEYPSNDPLNPSPSLVLPPSKHLWNVSMHPFYRLIWNDHHLGVRLLPLCLTQQPASNTERD